MAEDGNGSILLKPSMAWGVQEIVKARLIGEIRFLVEFGSEQTLKFVLNGGPWQHKGDALILVKYDGFSKLSDVLITSLPVWVRFYDIPVIKKSSFVRALGGKLGNQILYGR